MVTCLHRPGLRGVMDPQPRPTPNMYSSDYEYSAGSSVSDPGYTLMHVSLHICHSET